MSDDGADSRTRLIGSVKTRLQLIAFAVIVGETAMGFVVSTLATDSLKLVAFGIMAVVLIVCVLYAYYEIRVLRQVSGSEPSPGNGPKDNLGDDPRSLSLALGLTGLLPNRNHTADWLASIGPETRQVRILAVSSLTATLPAGIRETFRNLTGTDIRCLLLDPASDFVERRASENPTRSRDGLTHHIRSGLELIRKAAVDNNLDTCKIRLYDEWPVFRLVFVDDKVLISYYPRGSADGVPVVMAEKGRGWLYSAMDKYFEALWDRSTDFCPDAPALDAPAT